MHVRLRNKRLLSAATLMGALLLSGEAAAEYGSAPGTFRGSDGSNACIGENGNCSSIGSTSNIYAKVNWQAGPLVGEPVIDTRIAWNTTLGGVTGLVPPIYSEADATLFLNSGEAAEHLRLYQATARITVHHGNQTYTIDSDLGVPEGAGVKTGYNVAASPSWDRLFRNSNGDFIPAAQAKEIFASRDMAGAEATLVSAKMDTSKFEQWWLDKNVERYAAPLREAIDGRLAALEANFGLPTEELRAEIAALKGGKNAQALIDKLEGILHKLSPDRIPAKFLGTGPDKLARLHAYGLSIANSEDALRAATKHLPPMPGSSEAYEIWYDNVAVRINRDAARLAHLQGRKEEAERAEFEAAEAVRKVKERDERLAIAKHNKREAARRRKERDRRDAERNPKSFSDTFGYADDDFAYSGNSGFGGTGWNSGGGTACGYGTYDIGNGQCSYFYGGDSSSSSASGNDCVSEWNAYASNSSEGINDVEGRTKFYEGHAVLGQAYSDCMHKNGN
ncbi:MAG: hypothetical protein K8F90_17760 [Hyphomicrobiales bacterium]|nr:hypothetical protein [Hyphomicrobiales bacterium]